MTPQTTTSSQPKPKIRYLGRTQYTVESRTRPGRVHHVDTYHLTCTCEAGRYGKRCWAITTALHYESWRRHELAKAAAPVAQPSGMAALQDAFYGTRRAGKEYSLPALTTPHKEPERMTTIKERLALGAAKAQASVTHGHRMTGGWASLPDDDGGTTWVSRCADRGMAVSVASITHRMGGDAYDTDCPGGPEEQ